MTKFTSDDGETIEYPDGVSFGELAAELVSGQMKQKDKEIATLKADLARTQAEIDGAHMIIEDLNHQIEGFRENYQEALVDAKHREMERDAAQAELEELRALAREVVDSKLGIGKCMDALAEKIGEEDG